MQKKNMFLAFIMIALIALGALAQIPLPVGACVKEERELQPISGSNVDTRTFYWGNGLIADGFATTATIDLPVAVKEDTQTRFAFAVGLGVPWIEENPTGPGYYTYRPYIREMWVKVQGDADYSVTSLGSISDNTGTGDESAIFGPILALLETLFTLYEMVNLIPIAYEEPPNEEWDRNEHWATATVRKQHGYPGLCTACASLMSYFHTHKWHTLNITAEARLCIKITTPMGLIMEFYIATYRSSFLVNVAADKTPETPSKPDGETTVYRNVWYPYSTSTIDPEGDDIQYQFEFTGPGLHESPMTGWYPSGQTGSIAGMWENDDPLGTYQVRARAQDIYEEWSCWSSYLTVNLVNSPPNTPPTPVGQTTVYRNVWYPYSTCATDPDGDNIRYHLSATGPGNPYQNTTIWVDSGTPMIWNLLWEPTDSPGTYLIQTWVEDVHGALSGMSSLSVTMINRAPNTPSLTGPTSGYVGESYTYKACATDPDGDSVKYTFDWGDGWITPTGYYGSGIEVSRSHSWSSTGTYSVKVRATDVYGASRFSSILTVEITEPPLVDLVIRVPQAPPEGVKIWVDGNLYMAYENSPVSITVAAGQHTIEAERAFLKEEWMQGMYFVYVFDHWSDGSEANPRTIHLTSDKTLAAYYLRSKWGILASEIK